MCFLFCRFFFPSPVPRGDFKEAYCRFPAWGVAMWVTCCTLQKGTGFSAPVAQIHTDCIKHPIHLWNHTTEGSGLREGNVWERNQSICLVSALDVWGTHSDRIFRIASLEDCVLRNQTAITWSSKDNWLTHNPARLTNLIEDKWDVRSIRTFFLESG